MEILEFTEDRILTREDTPCWKCASTPVEQEYIPVYRGASISDPEGHAQRLKDSGWADIHVIGSVVCILIRQDCPNQYCLRDARKMHPLEKLARCADENHKSPNDDNSPDFLDIVMRDT